jgi:CheY-like chemotaxis protein
VLNNLLGNAIKYSPPGSRVDVHVTHDEDMLAVAVIDHGRGIPAEELDNLFQPFALTSVRPTAGETRTGLGLAITRRVVEGHGGTLDVTSAVGVGSTFRFALPLLRAGRTEATSPAGNQGEMQAVPAPASARVEKPMPAAPPASSRPCTVLLAEDNLPNQKIVLHLLRELGCEAEAVDTGGKVLEALKRRPFDLVLMDVRMPEMDGIEATRRLRRELPREAQPIVYALTAGVAENEVQLCLDAGMDGFLSKPVVRAELAALCTGKRS